MDNLELLDLVKDVWNPAAPNIRGMRPVTGEVFLTRILWPKLQRYDRQTVRDAMEKEIGQGKPPQILAVADRCEQTMSGPYQGISPPADETRDEPCPAPSPFDESRRGDAGYCAARLFGATLAMGFAGDKAEALRSGAEFAGITEDAFRAHLGDLSAKGRLARRSELESVGEILAGQQ